MQSMSEMIDENNNNDVEIESESYDSSEEDYTERRPRSRERGLDKKPRTYRANSMRNLTQFNQRPEQFVQYLKDEKGLDLIENSKLVKPILVLMVLVLVIFLGWKFYNHYCQNKQDDEDIEESYQ